MTFDTRTYGIKAVTLKIHRYLDSTWEDQCYQLNQLFVYSRDRSLMRRNRLARDETQAVILCWPRYDGFNASHPLRLSSSPPPSKSVGLGGSRGPASSATATGFLAAPLLGCGGAGASVTLRGGGANPVWSIDVRLGGSDMAVPGLEPSPFVLRFGLFVKEPLRCTGFLATGGGGFLLFIEEPEATDVLLVDLIAVDGAEISRCESLTAIRLKLLGRLATELAGSKGGGRFLILPRPAAPLA